MSRFNFKLRQHRHELDDESAVKLLPLPRPIVAAERVPRFVHVPPPVVAFAGPAELTFEGAPGFAREPRAELYLLAVSNMVGEDTFYEAAVERHARFVALVADVAVADPAWFARFVPWLRNGARLRTAAVVAALEGARAQVAAGIPGSRAVVDSALQRADEPGEAVAYARHDRVVILTDEQAAYHGRADVAAAVPAEVPVYTWNLAGYRLGHTSPARRRYTFGGLSDAAFGMIGLVESGEREAWPF